jgi:RimJ/RimL family protein N-acetyltransferase
MEMVRLIGRRVILRPWVEADREPFAAMNADPDVMRHFVSTWSRAQSDAMADRVFQHFDRFGYGLWALQTPEMAFAGFVGLSPPVPFEIPVPGFGGEQREIGWRLARAAWGRGDATQAAALARDHAFKVLRWPGIVSFTAHSNRRSMAVMERIGLAHVGDFDHPRVPEGHPTRPHALYALTNPAMRGGRS